MASSYLRPAVVSLAVLVAGVAGWPSAAGAKPINQQNCKEFRKTSKRIVRDLDPKKPVEVQRKAAKDAGRRGDRVAQLDGCLSKEAKMPTPPTSPTGAAGTRESHPTPWRTTSETFPSRTLRPTNSSVSERPCAPNSTLATQSRTCRNLTPSAKSNNKG